MLSYVNDIQLINNVGNVVVCLKLAAVRNNYSNKSNDLSNSDTYCCFINSHTCISISVL